MVSTLREQEAGRSTHSERPAPDPRRPLGKAEAVFGCKTQSAHHGLNHGSLTRFPTPH